MKALVKARAEPGLWLEDVPVPAIGRDDALIGDIHALRDLGATAIDFDFENPDPDQVIADMRRFRERILARAARSRRPA